MNHPRKKIATVREGPWTSLDWASLIDKGYMQNVKITNQLVQESFIGTSAEYLMDRVIGHEHDVYIDMFFSYLNVPTIGKSILGDSEYQRLMNKLNANEQAIIVMSRGHNSFLAEDFIPASIPDLLILEQNGLPVEIRDLNFYDTDNTSFPYSSKFSHYKIFYINAKGALDPASEWQFSLLVNRSRGEFFQVTTSQFTQNYQLPMHFFKYEEVKNNQPTPPWMIIWKSRIVDVFILVSALTLLTLVVVFQHEITKREKLFRWIRRGFLLFTLVFIGWYAKVSYRLLIFLLYLNQ